ncbi:uncharacterized protein LOC144065818 [Stigmatopora argus]
MSGGDMVYLGQLRLGNPSQPGVQFQMLSNLTQNRSEGLTGVRERGDGLPESVQEGLAGRKRDVARQHLEGGGIPGAVDSQQAEALEGCPSHLAALEEKEVQVGVVRAVLMLK